MFNMSNLLITLQSSKKSYTFPLSDTSPYSVTSNFSDMFPRQNRVGKSLSCFCLFVCFVILRQELL